jgi:hypothetical protein
MGLGVIPPYPTYCRLVRIRDHSMRQRTISRLPMVVRGLTGAAMGYAIVCISTENPGAAIAAALVGALIVGAVGGVILSTTAWAMIGGALVGGVALGIGSILVTGISKASIYGDFLGAPLGASFASRLGLRIEAMSSVPLKEGDSPSNAGVWDRELDSGRKGALRHDKQCPSFAAGGTGTPPCPVRARTRWPST